jgi:hypothetical protein
MRHTLLNKALPKRRDFNPSSKEDLIELKYFLTHGRWIASCPFWEEGNWTEIPAMCLNKFAKYSLNDL